MHPVRALLGQLRARSEGPLGADRTVPEILNAFNAFGGEKGF